MGKSGPLERAQLANQIQGFKIPDRSDAWENKNDINFRLNLASVYRAEKSSIFIPPSFPDCWAQKTKLWQNYSLSENVEFHEF